MLDINTKLGYIIIYLKSCLFNSKSGIEQMAYYLSWLERRANNAKVTGSKPV